MTYKDIRQIRSPEPHNKSQLNQSESWTDTTSPGSPEANTTLRRDVQLNVEQNPKILAQRFRNMGLINNAERDTVLALPASEQLNAVRSLEAKAEQVRVNAGLASQAGLLTGAEFMALYHCANEAADIGKRPIRYSLEERDKRGKQLAELVKNIKEGKMTVDEAKVAYHQNGIISAIAPKSIDTVSTLPVKKIPVIIPVPINPKIAAVPKVMTPKNPVTIKPTGPAVIDTTSKTAVTNPPTSQSAFIKIGDQTRVFTRAMGDVYNQFFPDGGKKNPENSILVSSSPKAKEFQIKITKLLVENDTFLTTALHGREIEFCFCSDLDKIPDPKTKKINPPEIHSSGLTAIEGERTNPTFIGVKLNPALLEDPAKALMLVDHELTHVAFGISGLQLSKEDEERWVVARSVKKLRGILDRIEDPTIKEHLRAHLINEEERVKNLPSSYKV